MLNIKTLLKGNKLLIDMAESFPMLAGLGCWIAGHAAVMISFIRPEQYSMLLKILSSVEV